MLYDLYGRIKRKVLTNTEPVVYEVITKDDDDYTDEIEKALWDIKDALDLPTEEIEIAVNSRKSLKNK
ncbi:MAG TPA: hypothetical protein DHV22_14980 [Xanthomarina gelatinilytica]|uniref:Uncharacterized protein n=1 Tax=Xanthomarina gelatinilytica TaxID=1137281 RepID=A0A3D6BVS5_9FLAO|nr:hypothetical protein [Xanthomarina gelatinilytica]|tara:strand:+ start:5540 stop:5743 length:204 start_codon:yes stop_codon:yes gene_type:complete